MINWEDFEKIDMRLGTILEVVDFENARKPAYKLRIDFEKNIDDSGQAVIIICCFAILAQMNLSFLQMIALKFFNLNLELLSEKHAVGFSPHSIFLDQLPKLFVLEKGLPLGLFKRVQRMINCYLLFGL